MVIEIQNRNEVCVYVSYIRFICVVHKLASVHICHALNGLWR